MDTVVHYFVISAVLVAIGLGVAIYILHRRDYAALSQRIGIKAVDYGQARHRDGVRDSMRVMAAFNDSWLPAAEPEVPEESEIRSVDSNADTLRSWKRTA